MKQNTTNAAAENMSDEAIIELYWQRQEKAIQATDQKYGKYLFTIAYNIVKNSMDCEECLNDTYLGTWNSIPPKRPPVFQTFLSKIMRSQALIRFRRNAAAKRIPSEMVSSLEELDECMAYNPSVEEEYLVGELSRVLNSYLHSLTDRQTFIFICRYYYSDTISHIASMLGLSENTIFRELANIRKGLKERLEREGVSYE
ncbi:MAG: sigma-70 family RNA polymerase sigma factor [Clostridia bacterium]|nr:sigma-70 family RNA polymerase sigma factor [Clostridia bacterium]